MHESSLFTKNAYITLTYNKKHLPPGGNLDKKHYQDFMKRLRFKNEHKIRYYHSGEYGGDYGRPHYHALLFNHNFDDLKFHKYINGIPLFTSKELTKTWGMGHCSVGTVTMESAAYVARYIMKKIHPDKRDQGQAQKDHYTHVDQETGEYFELLPEYSTMSRNIGKQWFEKYQSDVYPKDFLTFKGEKYKPPKFYDRLYEEIHPLRLAKIKRKRIGSINQHKKDQTIDRLRTRERVTILRTNQLIRPISETNYDP